ncbi:MAG: hypothetical protein Q9157_002084 [Trypethelium eluteriae]
MSNNRSSSGVRNLRAMFENKDDDVSESRSRSPAGSTASENRRTSKVRASFVSVEPGSSQMDTEVPSSASARRESFSLSESQDSDKIAELKKTVSQEKEERKQSKAAETIPESAIETTPSPSPAIRPRKEKAMGDFVNKAGTGLKNTASVPEDTPGANPDKMVSAVEETPVTMRPTDPKDESAVSGGEALPPPANPISRPLTEAAKASPVPNGTSVPSASSKFSSVKEKPGMKQNGTAAAKPQSSATKSTETKSPSKSTSTRPFTSSTKTVSTAKPSGNGTAPKSPSTRQSRMSLESTKSTTSARSSTATRPTAASSAKKNDSSHATSESSKSKPRSPTRPVKLPAHLTAPTASSAAKHGDAPSTTSSAARKPAPRPNAGTTKPAPSRREAPRQSLPSASPAKRAESNTNARGADDGFLARMMRPTASSANKTAEKPEVRSPPNNRSTTTKPRQSEQSLTAKAKKAVSAATKGKETKQNGSASHNESHHEDETLGAIEDISPAESTHEAVQETPDVLERSKAETMPEAVPETIPDDVIKPKQESAREASPERTNDIVPEPAAEPAIAPFIDVGAEPKLEPAAEPAQTPIKDVGAEPELESEQAEESQPEKVSASKAASTREKDFIPEAAETTVPGSTETPAKEVEHIENSNETPTSLEQTSDKSAETSEKDTKPNIDVTPDHTRTADTALEQTPAFDEASIR